MAIVIDASLAIAWCLRDRDDTTWADMVMERASYETIIVPDHRTQSFLVRSTQRPGGRRAERTHRSRRGE